MKEKYKEIIKDIFCILFLVVYSNLFFIIPFLMFGLGIRYLGLVWAIIFFVIGWVIMIGITVWLFIKGLED